MPHPAPTPAQTAPQNAETLPIPVFLMDGDKIRKHQSPVKLFMGAAEVLGVDEHRHGGGYALIAAAGKDDGRQFTAVHARIAACGSRSTRQHADIAVALLLRNAPDLCPPTVGEAFFGKRAVVFNLAGDRI